MGANPLLTAYVNGAGTPGTAVQDGIFRLVGSDYVTIDGINLTENPLNITNPSTMEYGFGLFKQSVSNGCQFNTIKIVSSHFLISTMHPGHFQQLKVQGD